MDVAIKEQLVVALLDCLAIKDHDSRNVIVGELPKNITGGISRHKADRVDVLNILNGCLKFPDGMDLLIEWVQFIDGLCIPVQQLIRLWETLSRQTQAVEPRLPEESQTELESLRPMRLR